MFLFGMASRDPNAKVTPSKSPRTRNASARTPPHPTNKTPGGGASAKTPTPKKRSAVGKGDDDNEPPKPVVSRYNVILVNCGMTPHSFRSIKELQFTTTKLV